MKSIRIKPKECVFVIFALLCGVSKLYPFTISTYWTYTLACLWIIWSYNYKKEDGNRILAKLHLRLFVVPIIVMCFYTIIIWFVSSPSGIGGEIEYYSRLFSNTIFLIMNIIRSVFFFQDLVNVNNYLEVHDLTFALGFFLIFFLVFGKKCNISNLNLKIVISFIYIFLGYKRIELLAILVVALFYYLFDRYSKTTSRKYIVPGIIAILICFLFIAIIYDHRLNTIAMQYNINFNHRLDTWQYWANKTKFSIGFWGLGIGYVDKETFLLHGKNGLINNGLIVLSGMHSDLFKKYVEIGMIPFFIWLIYILIFKTKILYKKQGFLVAEIYLLLTIYAIILYLTDNIYSYFLCNCCYILIPMAIYDKQNNMVMQ